VLEKVTRRDDGVTDVPEHRNKDLTWPEMVALIKLSLVSVLLFLQA
jgi:hypothetical protein